MRAKTQPALRFAFGRNWHQFLNQITDERIAAATKSVFRMVCPHGDGERSKSGPACTEEARQHACDGGIGHALAGRTFLDIGHGSGLFSLAARRMGASVRSFDYDQQSVACALVLKSRFDGDGDWVVERGDILDQDFVRSLPTFDVVYSWGVLHHTGDMWQALRNVATLLSDRGRLCLALSNDQGWRSKIWRLVKRCYCASTLGKWAMCAIFIPYVVIRCCCSSVVRRRNTFAEYGKNTRGMSVFHDWFDWLGGYPYEVASVGEVVDFFSRHGLRIEKIKAVNNHGCNEFTFVK